MDLSSLADICNQKCRLKTDLPLVAGISGGADSLALADCLSTLGYRLIVAHYDHRLREGSQADADYVKDFARLKDLPFETGGGDVLEYAQKINLSIEEAARRMRYKFLFDICRKHDAQALAVGHTADDQVETVLMHMLRGAGLSGMKGMTWRSIIEVFDPTIPLVRPLLGVWRKDTEEWCRSHGLDARIDPTNRDTAYARNRLRREIIPLLESYSPHARQHIQKMAEHLQGDYRILSQLVDDQYSTCLKSSGEGYLCFNRTTLEEYDPALQAWILRKAAFQLVRELRDFDAAAVARCLGSIATTSAGWKSDLPGGLRIHVDATEVTLFSWQADLPGLDWPQLAEGFDAMLPSPGELVLGNDWLLRAEDTDLETAYMRALDNEDPQQAWIDMDSLPGRLTVRRAPAGQRFTPLGMSTGSQKLSDFWVNVRLPQRARAGWPVIFSGNEVVWVPGFRLAHAFRLTARSRSVLRLTMIKQAT
jgi:tRNA(Ile)-lysidine synthase